MISNFNFVDESNNVTHQTDIRSREGGSAEPWSQMFLRSQLALDLKFELVLRS